MELRKEEEIAPPDSDDANDDALAPVADYTAAPPFDAARYWSYLEGIAASDAEKTALLETLWTVMAGFVELGFGLDPVQTIIPALIRSSLAEVGQEAPNARDPFDAAASPANGKEESR